MDMVHPVGAGMESRESPPIESTKQSLSDAVAFETGQSETYKTAEPRNHLAELDALRGIAIIMVVVNHLCAIWQSSIGPLAIPVLDTDLLGLVQSHLAVPGVPLFFLLSGYLLTWTEGKRAKRGNYSLRSYALRRVLRLVPAYYVALLVAFVVVSLHLGYYKISLVDMLAHLAFVQSLTPAFAWTISPTFWSLTPEVVFYCLLPVIILKLPRLWPRLVLFVVLYLIAMPIRVLALQAWETPPKLVYGQMDLNVFLSSLPITLLYLFLVGVLLRMMVEHLDGRPVSHLQLYIALALFLSSLAVFVIITPALGFLNLLGLGTLGWTAVYIAQLLGRDFAMIGFFASALLGAPILHRLLKWRPLSFIGLISYSMFVFHGTLLVLFGDYFLRVEGVKNWLRRDLVTMWASFSFYSLSMFVVIGIISYLGYRYIESPFLRIKPK